MASGDSLVQFMALHYEPRSSSAMTIDTRNMHPVLDADAAAVEYARFSTVLPEHYGSSGITVNYHVAFSSAVAATAVVAGAWESLAERGQDMDADGFATQKYTTIAAPGTAGVLIVGTCTFTHGAEIDSILPGEGFRFEIAREAGSSVDNAAGDLEIRFVEILET